MMCSEYRGFWGTFVFLVCLASARVGHAQVDLTGTWDIDLLPTLELTWSLTQTGSELTVVESPSGAQGTGSIDPATRTFSVWLEGECGGSTYRGSVSYDDLLVVGTVSLGVFVPIHGCGQVSFEFTGTRRCGNGTLDPGEDCDDFNAWPGDCCSSTCRFEAAGAACVPGALTCAGGTCDGIGTCDVTTPVAAPAGTPCRRTFFACDATELCDGTSFACPVDQWQPEGTLCGYPSGPCDVAEYCTGTSPFCPEPVSAPDSDGDGLGDPCDRCPTGEPLTSTKLTLGKFDGVLENDKLTVNTTITPSVPIDPVASGLSIVVGRPGDGDGTVELSLPPGAYDPLTSSGWTVSRSGQAWIFRGYDVFDPLVVRVRRRRPDRPDVQIKVRGKRGIVPLILPRGLIALQIAFGLPDAESPVCAEALFHNGPPPLPRQCSLRRGGTTLDCRG